MRPGLHGRSWCISMGFCMGQILTLPPPLAKRRARIGLNEFRSELRFRFPTVMFRRVPGPSYEVLTARSGVASRGDVFVLENEFHLGAGGAIRGGGGECGLHGIGARHVGAEE